ncbi:hypothetical protein HYV49_01735 [Candidatus Pacearchaeota archaeon]|nr:hypothetical protein [Candidatus Pacearchaeota archaeon]
MTEQENIEKNIEMIESFAKKHMTKEAISRYGNLKLAHPERALKAIVQITQIVQSGIEEIDDAKLKEILRSLR